MELVGYRFVYLRSFLHVSGRDFLYLVTFEDGIVAMRGAHQFSENFTFTHDQLNGWVSMYRNDNITQRLTIVASI